MAGERDQVEADLVANAKTVDPARLRRAARWALDALDRSEAEADAYEDATCGMRSARPGGTHATSTDSGADGPHRLWISSWAIT